MDNIEKTKFGKGNPLFHTHFVFNTLNIIQHYIIISDKKSALLSLNRFSKLFRQYLVLSQSENIPIAEEIKMIHLYLQLQVLRYTSKLTYDLMCSHNFQFTEKIPVVLMVVILDDLIESLIKKGEKKLHLKVGFNEVSDAILLCLEAGDFMDHDDTGMHTVKTDWKETGINWRKHIETHNGKSPYRISYQAEKIFPEDNAHKAYRWRINVSIPAIV